ALIFIDLDEFKQINQRFSHQVGDQALRQISNLLSDTARGSDLTARIGGDEFVIVFPNTPLVKAKQLCERLRTNLEKFNWEVLMPGMMPTMSIGLAEAAQGDSVERLLDRADMNMRKAKREG